MSHRHVYFFVIFTYLLACAFSKFVFDTEKDERCITPNNKPGVCVSIHNCSTLYNAFLKKRTSDKLIKKYLRDSHCRTEQGPTGKINPIVCCEQDAGACETPQNEIGSCVPIGRCDPLLRYLESKPLFSGNIISYIQQSECKYTHATHTEKEKRQTRFCCPLISERTNQLSDRTNIPIKKLANKFSVTPQLILDLTKLPIKRKVKLPEPGDINGNCGVGEIDERIIRYETDIYDHPWMALIKYQDGQWGCSGSIITNKYILTAAQCVKGPKVIEHKSISIIRVGEWDTFLQEDCKTIFEFRECSDDPFDSEPEEIIPHANFSLNPLRNDIALIRLKNTLPYTDYIRPICLPATSKKPINFNHLTVVGWRHNGSERKKEFLSPLQLYDKEKCKTIYTSRFELGQEHFCASGRVETWQPHNNTCTGDLGGPVIAYEIFDDVAVVSLQIGIISAETETCGVLDKPSVYTNVNDYMDWIFYNLKP